jgi:hypothetical protein
MKDTQRPSLNKAFRLEKFDNEILLYSVTDTKAVYLNDTATLVYGLCDSGQSVGEIIALLEKAYHEQHDAIRGDVTTALQQLLENEAIFLHD